MNSNTHTTMLNISYVRYRYSLSLQGKKTQVCPMAELYTYCAPKNADASVQAEKG